MRIKFDGQIEGFRGKIPVCLLQLGQRPVRATHLALAPGMPAEDAVRRQQWSEGFQMLSELFLEQAGDSLRFAAEFG